MKKILFILLSAFFIFTACNINAQFEEDELPEEKATNKEAEYHSYGYYLLKETDSLSVMNKPNMIYKLDYEFDLKGQTVTVADNCIIKFGSKSCVKNGKIIFTNTELDGTPCFKDMSFGGTITNDSVVISWFGLLNEAQEKVQTRNASLISEIADLSPAKIIVDGYYPISSAINYNAKATFVGADWDETKFCDTYEYEYVPKNGFYTLNWCSCFSLMKNGASVSLYGIKITGDKNYYTQTELENCGYNIEYGDHKDNCGIFVGRDSIKITEDVKYEYQTSIGVIYNSVIEGFTYGIRAMATFLEKIQNTTFDSCRYGLFTVWTSDFDVFSCKFINCLPKGSSALSDLEGEQSFLTISKIKWAFGAGVYLSATGMINLNNNYFENNCINYILSECDIIVNIQNNVMKSPKLMDIALLAQKTNGGQSVQRREGHTWAIDCLTITGNTFIRSGVNNSKTNCILYLRDAETDDLTKSTGYFTWGMNFIFSENKVIDTRPEVSSDDAIFLVTSASPVENSAYITCYDNDYSKSKSKYFVTYLKDAKPTNGLIHEGEGIFNFTTDGDIYGAFTKWSVCNDPAGTKVLFKTGTYQ